MAQKQEITRTIILAAAQSTFAQYGKEKTTIEQIARGAKVARSIIHSYFTNKDQLYLPFSKKRSIIFFVISKQLYIKFTPC